MPQLHTLLNLYHMIFQIKTSRSKERICNINITSGAISPSVSWFAQSILVNMRAVFLSFLLVFLSFLGSGTSLGSDCGVFRPFKDLWFKKFFSCEHNRTVLQFDSNKYFVEAIDYKKQKIHVTYPGLLKENCSTLPLFHPFDYHFRPFYISYPYSFIFFLICRSPVKSPYYVDTAPCITAKDFSDSFIYSRPEEHLYSYALIGDRVASDIEDSCTICRKILSRPLSVSNSSNISFAEIHHHLASGFDLSYYQTYPLWKLNVFWIYVLRLLALLAALLIAGRAVVGFPVLIFFFIYKCKRRHLSEYDNIEQFLRGPNNLLPIRYSYKQIKQMTNNFKDKLGKGGYGDVYKGKSRSGQLVAVKMLKESKGSGQDFINEVATIGRIYQVNVVRLVGFCVTGSKRALVYDYMPNGSLDKFIFSEVPNGVPLSWERAHEIAVGVARGIAYLHGGCHMQILHFDIKPHNVLLDDNFVPKLSDFGLAKLCSRQKSVVTLTAAKGTLGYMAPELIYRKLGGVSHKADVYSFGQLLLAMVGRKKLNALTDHSSRVYFSSWIYDKVNSGEVEELDLGAITKEEKDIVRKIILVALWCVQWLPADRPPMREVLEMLEGDLEGLKLPAKPLYYPPDSPPKEQGNNEDSGDSTFPLYESITLEIE